MDILNDFEECKENLEFTYPSRQEVQLISLRNKYALESLMDSDDEIKTIKNILLWVNQKLCYDNRQQNPPFFESEYILENYSHHEKGVNCFIMALVFNDLCLSLGIKTRIITCYPFNKQINGRHVVNTVFSEKLNKWILADTTVAAFFYNAIGDMLGLEELYTKESTTGIFLSGDANLNGKPLKNLDFNYLDWFFHYLYCFKCSLSGSPGALTAASNTSVLFYPRNSAPALLINKRKRILISTAGFFWQKPFSNRNKCFG